MLEWIDLSFDFVSRIKTIDSALMSSLVQFLKVANWKRKFRGKHVLYQTEEQ